MPGNPSNVSVTEPLGPALRRVKTILFAPFDLRKWFVIGFCAWLSSCGESGGGGGGGGGGGNRGQHPVGRDDIRRGLETAWDYVRDNLVWILPLAVFLFLVGVTVWLVAVWLRSRGKFMLLHCVALNQAEVQVPWEAYARHAHSLFLCQVLLGATSFIIIFPILVGCATLLLRALMAHGSLLAPILLVILGVLCAGVVGIVFSILQKLLVDFAVPIMYLRTPSVRAAGGELATLVSANPGRFALYLLFSVVLALIMGTLVLVVVVVTCCLAGCLLLIPYIGTVLLLPIFVFKRSYALYYLEQYGPDYHVMDREVIADR